MKQMVWLLCPVCGNKTRLKVRQDTELSAVLPKMQTGNFSKRQKYTTICYSVE